MPPTETYIEVFHLTCPHADCRRVNAGKALVKAADPGTAAGKLLRTKLTCKYCGRLLTRPTAINLNVQVASERELLSWKQ